ncbi:MAG: hypothetical protein K2L71_04130 [Muribaculaceae bacterium]|nr:hypothetical protein [Muribaculaceae bacterium]
MKEKSKIKVLTPEEIKRQTASAYSGDSSESGCKMEGTCADNKKISCSGASCESKNETIKGISYLEYIKCYSADGTQVGGDTCDNSNVGSGVGDDPHSACDKKKVGQMCEWYDGKLHTGKCVKDDTGLYCKESQLP